MKMEEPTNKNENEPQQEVTLAQEETTVDESENLCPECGEPLDINSAECEQCGAVFDAPLKDEEPQENATATEQVTVQKHKQEPKTLKEFTWTPKRDQVNGLNKALKIMLALGFTEGTFNYNGNINFAIMDPSHTCMVSGEIDAGLGLGTLITEKPATIRSFTCDIQRFKRALGMDGATFSFGQNRCIVSDGSTKINIPLTDDEDPPAPEPNLPAGTELHVDFDEIFKKISKYLGSQSMPDHLNITVTNNVAKITGQNYYQTIEFNNLKANGPDQKGSFSAKMLKALRDSAWDAKWNISFSTDMPIKASTVITHSDYSAKETRKVIDAKINVYLAPRVEEDE